MSISVRNSNEIIIPNAYYQAPVKEFLCHLNDGIVYQEIVRKY
jgi:hypothetical protein